MDVRGRLLLYAMYYAWMHTVIWAECDRTFDCVQLLSIYRLELAGPAVI